MNIFVRNAAQTDWPVIRQICCKTGKSGNSIEPDRFNFFSENWIGPYEQLFPGYTYVVLYENQVAGYLTGYPDTKKFNRNKYFFHDLPLLLKILTHQYPLNADVQSFIKKSLRLQTTPEDSFSKSSQMRLVNEFPAHLHLNLLKQFRGKDLGKLLLESFEHDLKKIQCTGIHLYCGSGPVKFYEKNGFQTLEKILFNNKSEVFLMCKKIDH